MHADSPLIARMSDPAAAAPVETECIGTGTVLVLRLVTDGARQGEV
jgi:hypothetical protein